MEREVLMVNHKVSLFLWISLYRKQDVFLIENLWQEKFGIKNYMSDNYHPNLKGQKVIIKSLLKL